MFKTEKVSTLLPVMDVAVMKTLLHDLNDVDDFHEAKHSKLVALVLTRSRSSPISLCNIKSSLHQGSTESRKTLEQKFIFQIGTLNPHGINERFSFN